jgi:hypothetical protein
MIASSIRSKLDADLDLARGSEAEKSNTAEKERTVGDGDDGGDGVEAAAARIVVDDDDDDDAVAVPVFGPSIGVPRVVEASGLVVVVVVAVVVMVVAGGRHDDEGRRRL